MNEQNGVIKRPGRRAPLSPERLRAARQQAVMSIDELAEAAGMSPSHVGGLERGVHGASPKVVRDLAAALKVKPAALLEEAAK
jgi:transcriptional regulator with XRE-family HTH domain